MKTILVSGASGIIGYGILRSLRKAEKDLRLVGTSIYADSIAQAFCDVFEQAPRTEDDAYIEWLLEAIERHDVDLIVPGIEQDVYKWCIHREEIEASGTHMVLNRTELILLSQDKWEFYKALNEFGLPYALETSLTADFHLLATRYGLPFLLKPRRGYASKGIEKVRNIGDFLKHQQNIGPVLMAQPIVGSDEEEYSTSAFCDGAGGFYASMTLKRKLAKEGFTEKAEVVQKNDIEEEIVSALRALCACFKPVGPTNFQFRRHQGSLKLLEINPRVSSSTSIRTGFGYNESRMAIEFYLEDKIPVQPVVRSGKAIRYTEDFFDYEDRSHL